MNIKEFTRQDTGKHFLDSGDHYGRVYDSPVQENPVAFQDQWEAPATISLTHWIEKNFEENDYHAPFYEWAIERDGNWFELAPEFMEEQGFEGYVCVSRDNVYNGANDFDQVFVWEVYAPRHLDSVRQSDNGEYFMYDWYWSSEELVTVIYAHTGCDVRGGYSSPMFLTCTHHDYNGLPNDLVCGYYSNELSEEENEIIRIGYASHPFYEIEGLGLKYIETDLGEGCQIWKRIDNGASHEKGDIVKIFPEYYDI